MSIVGRMLGLLIAFSCGIIVSGFAMPVIWLVVRIARLIPVLTRMLGRMDMLVYAGGIVFGAVVAALALTAIVRMMGEEDRAAVLVGAFGGAIGGLGSSIMFFPIVGLL